MLKSRFIDILRTFSDAELRRFLSYLRSPFFNKNKNVIRLYEIIKKFHPDYDSRNCTKEKLFSKLFPGKKFNDTVIRILLADLGKLAEDFIGAVNIESNPYVQKRHIMKELQLRRVDNVFNKVLKEAEVILKDNTLGKEYGFYYRHDLESIKNNYYLGRNKQELITEIIAKKGESIICYTLIELFIISENILSNKNAYNVSPRFNFTDEFLSKIDFDALIKYVEVNFPVYYPVLGIFYYLYKTITDIDDKDCFSSAKNLFRAYRDEFNLNEKILIFTKIQNVCKEKSRGGSETFVRELFEIYQERINIGLLILPRRKYLNIWDYRDILVTAMELREWEWADSFVNEFVPKLEPEFQASGMNYGAAIVCFGKGMFETALEMLAKVKYDFFLFKIDTKNLTAKIFYELEYYEQATEIIDSYKHFLSKNKTVSEPYKLSNMNFIRIYSDLLKVKENRGKGLYELNQSFGNQLLLRNKSWICKKIEELNEQFG